MYLPPLLRRNPRHLQTRKGLRLKVSSTRYLSNKVLFFFDDISSQVSDSRIVIAVDASESNSDDLDLPERCRVLKLANSVTYDRLVIIQPSCRTVG